MADTVDWLGQSGETYTFNYYELSTNFKSVPGVYIFVKVTGGSLSPIYVGEAEDLKDRLTTNLENHHKYDCAINAGATHLCVMVVNGGEQARLDIETDIRQSYQPPCNDQ